MSETDRAIPITFSMKMSSLEKLEELEKTSGKNRSELLAAWVSSDWLKLHPEAIRITIDEELERR